MIFISAEPQKKELWERFQIKTMLYNIDHFAPSTPVLWRKRVVRILKKEAAPNAPGCWDDYDTFAVPVKTFRHPITNELIAVEVIP